MLAPINEAALAFFTAIIFTKAVLAAKLCYSECCDPRPCLTLWVHYRRVSLHPKIVTRLFQLLVKCSGEGCIPPGLNLLLSIQAMIQRHSHHRLLLLRLNMHPEIHLEEVPSRDTQGSNPLLTWWLPPMGDEMLPLS